MTARIYILGFVQGVGFRRFVKKNAQSLGLKGWVKNLPDGRVETLAQGSKEKIEELILICKKGTFFSDIKSIQVEWDKDSEDFSDFLILHE